MKCLTFKLVFLSLYFFPFLFNQILYSRIAVVLWKSFQGFKRINDALHNSDATVPNGKCKSTKKSVNELNLLGDGFSKKGEHRPAANNISPAQVRQF